MRYNIDYYVSEYIFLKMINKNLDIVKYLIEQGENINVRTKRL